MKTDRLQGILRGGFMALVLVGLASPGLAQGRRPMPNGGGPPRTQGERPDAKESAKPEAKTAGKVIAIVGADIETVTQGRIRQGVILIQDGKILDVGQNIEIPKDAEVREAKGKIITPGFVSLNMSRVGVGNALLGTGAKVADNLDPFDPNIKFCLGVGVTTCATQYGGATRRGFRFPDGQGGVVDLTIDEVLALHADGVLEDELLDHLLDEHEKYGHAHLEGDEPGLVSLGDRRFFNPGERLGGCPHCGSTLVHMGMGSFDGDAVEEPVLGGLGLALKAADAEQNVEVEEPFAPANPQTPRASSVAVIKLSYGNLDGMLVSESPFYSISSSALSGPFNAYSWRYNIQKTREYLDALAKHEAAVKAGDKNSKAPQKSVSDELIKLVKKEIPLRTDASTATQIREMIAMAQELDYRLVLDGAHESWLVADELGMAGVSVAMAPRDRFRPEPGNEDSTGSWIETPRVLQKAGVPFAVVPLDPSVSIIGEYTGLAGRDLTSLPLEAAFAVRGGADESTALAAITIVPARILGLEDRIGSIEKGKDADLLVLDGNPLDYRTYVDTAIVNGKVCYERTKDRVYPVFER